MAQVNTSQCESHATPRLKVPETAQMYQLFFGGIHRGDQKAFIGPGQLPQHDERLFIYGMTLRERHYSLFKVLSR